MSPFFWSFPQSGYELFHSKRDRFNKDFWREIRQFLCTPFESKFMSQF